MKSTFNIFENPVAQEERDAILLHLFEGGQIATLVKRKIRSSVTAFLAEKHDASFAAQNWELFAYRCILAFLASEYPQVYGAALSKDQVTRIIKDHPEAIALLRDLNSLIKMGRSEVFLIDWLK